MELAQYLKQGFLFNDLANSRMLAKLSTLADPAECLRIMSHLTNSQFKWMARLQGDPISSNMDWWLPQYPLSELPGKWQASLQPWLDYLDGSTDETLQKEVRFPGYDGTPFGATPAAIAQQLIYHSVHHRAQMQMIIRQQGVEPDFIDYIGTQYRRL
ncbi:MAG TPA: DinB family protein [Sediminibacterium sp.]|nr:DinB family protein [Sediminibacterium sp.]